MPPPEDRVRRGEDGRLGVSGWRLAVGRWQFAVGSWQLAVGGWRFSKGVGGKLSLWDMSRDPFPEAIRQLFGLGRNPGEAAGIHLHKLLR